MSKDYTSTLNLPKTDFPMRANLPEREPQMLNFWEEIGLYELMLESSEGCEQYILHDGPPFSNGNIHMGTALNKCLKDFINKSKAMEGKRIIYIPGWDNHGLPIESAIIKKNSLNRKKMSITEFRNACRKFAGNYVDIQREQFKRLGVLGDWENPYLTMDPEFEAWGPGCSARCTRAASARGSSLSTGALTTRPRWPRPKLNIRPTHATRYMSGSG